MKKDSEKGKAYVSSVAQIWSTARYEGEDSVNDVGVLKADDEC